jgi:hypothetical protein
VRLRDPVSGQDATSNDASTASPTVGPDGDVYFGILEAPLYSNHARGWLLHFSKDLSKQKPFGAFGWDDTASIVPASMVPRYHGRSTYLLMTKYNDYADGGGTGINRLAILDPNETAIDPISRTRSMRVVESIAATAPDPQASVDHPGAVLEWCINMAAVDPKTRSVFANNRDGRLYRWDLRTNRFSQVITLSPSIGEAYTPTAIGPDGTVYVIHDSVLFAVGARRSA